MGYKNSRTFFRLLAVSVNCINSFGGSTAYIYRKSRNYSQNENRKYGFDLIQKTNVKLSDRESVMEVKKN